MLDKIETGILLDYYGGMLTLRQQEILRIYCDMDFSLAEISEQKGISRQACLGLISTGNKKMREYEEKLGLVKKVKTISRELDKLLQETTDEVLRNKLQELLIEIKEI